MESINLQSLQKLIEKTLGEAIYRRINFDLEGQQGVVVLLTDELADHIIEMYNNTDFNAWDKDDPIHLPSDIFSDEVDIAAFKKYVGQHIIISLWGDPWPAIHKAPTFVPGARIDFADNALELAGCDLDFMCKSEGLDDVVFNMSLGVLAVKSDGIPDAYFQTIIDHHLNG